MAIDQLITDIVSKIDFYFKSSPTTSNYCKNWPVVAPQPIQTSGHDKSSPEVTRIKNK